VNDVAAVCDVRSAALAVRRPLMNPLITLGLIAAYLVTIFGLVKFMKNREAFKLKEFAFLHSAYSVVCEVATR
jgi:hypothetical protein